MNHVQKMIASDRRVEAARTDLLRIAARLKSCREKKSPANWRLQRAAARVIKKIAHHVETSLRHSAIVRREEMS